MTDRKVATSPRLVLLALLAVVALLWLRWSVVRGNWADLDVYVRGRAIADETSLYEQPAASW